jgi:hypothetical protein
VEEQAVIVRFGYAADSLGPLHGLEQRLEAAVADAGVGELDGNDIAPDLSDGTLYLYGPDADALFAVARPLLAGAGCLRAASVTLRYGPPEDGVPERVVSLDAEPGAAADGGA